MAGHNADRRGSTHRRTRLRRRWLALAIGTVFLLVTLAAILTVSHRPNWYHPASIDHARLRMDKQALAHLLDEIAAALNDGRSIPLHLPEDQLNRWIAARAQIWPDAETDMGPLRLPCVTFLDGEILAGATLTVGGFRSVVTLRARIDIQEENLVIRVQSARIGALPVPRRWLHSQFASLSRTISQATAPRESSTLIFENRWIWPNGKRPCRLGRVEVAPGRVHAVLEPLARPKR